jgi:beta-N-acetylhexosaminidase
MIKHFFRMGMAGLAALSFLASCHKNEQPTPVPPTPEVTKYSLKPLSEMTLKEKVGQLFNVRPEILSPESTGYVTKGTQAMTDTFKEYPVGGITIFAGNITNPTQLKNFTSFLHDLGNYPMLCIDEEGGRVARIAKNTQFNVPVYQSMEAIGKTGDSKNAYNAGDAIGTYLMNYGLDVDLAPVSDVNTNPNNVVIGDRAFGSDPALVADMASEFLKGLKHAKVEGCQKHFPGHGDTSTDSHYGYAESKKTWEELSVCEMLPFRKGIQADTKMIMTAHISLPNVTGDDTPSTLSKTILQEKLRGELGYKGIIITDSMGMGAITKQYSSGEAAVRAIEAGVDIILDPEDFREAFKAVMDAVEGGRISMAMIDERVTRVLELKKSILQSRGLLK